MPDNSKNMTTGPATPLAPSSSLPPGGPAATAPGGCPSPAAADPRLAPPGGWSPYAPMPEEDEINLLDLFIVLLKHKWMIFWIVFLAGFAALVISLQMPNVYRSEATIAPTTQEKSGGGLAALGGFGAMIAAEVGIGATGSLDQFEVVLKSRELTNSVIKEHNLLPVIYEKAWDPKTGDWKVAGPPSLFQKSVEALKGIFGPATEEKTANASKSPSLQEAYTTLQGMLSVKPEKKQNVMRLGVESEDPKRAQAILNHYIVGLSEFLRRQTLEDAAAQQVHLTQQLSKTTDPLLRNRLYELIAKQIEKETLAKIQRYYSFNVIDPAFVPEKKFKPKRAQICMISVVVAFFIAVFLAFFLEYVKNLRTREDPERLANLRKSLRLRNQS